MSSDFTLLAEHMQAVLGLPEASREGYLASLPEEIARQLRELLPFRNATFDLSQVPAVELALDVLAQPQPEFVGRWRVQRLLGRGGMASVYLVERSDGAIRQLAACKIGYARTELEDGLRRETATLLDLAHPGIAHVLDFGHTGGRPWLVSEFIEGADIVAWANERHLPFASRLELFERVLQAVAHAHERLLLHQDIKPGNILVDAAGHPRLIDFGLATVLSGRGDSPVAGYTPRYASPEQKRGETLTVRSDIFSLGVTLDVLLEGVAPARGSDDARAVIEKARHDEPEARYASAAAMAVDLRAICELRPVSARTATAGYRLKRFLQRNPVSVALVAFAVLSLVVGVGLALWQAQRATLAAREAQVSAAMARAVQDFLTRDILGRATPAAPGYDAKAGIEGVINAATAAVDARFASEPLTAAAVRAALAAIHRTLGHNEVAIEQAAESAHLYEAQLGTAHESTLTSRYLQAQALISAQRLDEAEQLLDAADNLAGSRLNEETPFALEAAVARGFLEGFRMRPEKALAAHQRAAELLAKLDPDDMVLHANITNNQAAALSRLKQPERAVELLLAAPLSRYSEPAQAVVHRSLAAAYRLLRDNDKALEHAKQAVELFRKVYGVDHYSTLTAYSTLSSIHHEMDDCPKALETGRIAWEGMRRIQDEMLQATLIERGNFGGKQFDCGQTDEGLPNVLAALDGLRRHYGADNWAAQAFTAYAAGYLEQVGRPADALAELEQLTQFLDDEDVLALIARLRETFSERGETELLARLEWLTGAMKQP